MKEYLENIFECEEINIKDIIGQGLISVYIFNIKIKLYIQELKKKSCLLFKITS